MENEMSLRKLLFQLVLLSVLVVLTTSQSPISDISPKSAKYKRSERLIKSILSEKLSDDFKISPTLSPGLSHNRKGPAILSIAFNTEYVSSEAHLFAGTARDVGYTGDIVVGIIHNSTASFITALQTHNVLIYSFEPDCEGTKSSTVCAPFLHTNMTKVSIAMMRFHLYNWWARLYDPDALLLVADFKDVIFQSDPFLYRPSEWQPPVADLVAFQEALPNKIIYRCAFNKGWIKACYGLNVVKQIGANPVSCSGTTIGSARAILIYTYFMVQQLDPRQRYPSDSPLASQPNGVCLSLGMDQGFHNYLIYSRTLEPYLKVKLYQQGEGPVNTVGAFFGKRAILQRSLVDWQVLRGDPPYQYFANWNGDASPVIHQADRYLGNQLGEPQDNYRLHLFTANRTLARDINITDTEASP